MNGQSIETQPEKERNKAEEQRIGPAVIASWIKEADMVLVGLGAEVSGDWHRMAPFYENLELLLKKKNFFILTSNTDGCIHKKPVFSMLAASPHEQGVDEGQWKGYMNWISCTLGKKLVILELGEDFSDPGLMRWPFEKMAMINQRAKLIRVGQSFSQIPKELEDCAVAVPINSENFLKLLTEQL